MHGMIVRVAVVHQVKSESRGRRRHGTASDGGLERIPDTIEAEAGEVFHIAGGKLRHSRRAECQGQPHIDDPSTSEHRRRGVPPHLTHDGHALDQPPPGIRAIPLTDVCGFLCRLRMREYDWIPYQQIDLDEDLLRDYHVVTVAQLQKKAPGSIMLGHGLVQRIDDDVRVE